MAVGTRTVLANYSHSRDIKGLLWLGWGLGGGGGEGQNIALLAARTARKFALLDTCLQAHSTGFLPRASSDSSVSPAQ